MPNRDPTPVVTAIARTPQPITRTIAGRIWAPPSFAPSAPRPAKAPTVTVHTVGTIQSGGTTTAAKTGIAAATLKVRPEATAASRGLAL